MSDVLELGLFEGYGIEIEHMIVDTETLSVRPIADQLLEQVGGGHDCEVELGALAWSNELALHVVEMKTNGPVASLAGVGAAFHDGTRRMLELLEPHGALVMPTAMHPWMDPDRELTLWPHENDVVYRTFHRIFDCRGHGWANLQSVHVNLPFRGDDELGRLHAATRVALPILPALAASSPVVGGVATGMLDTRMHYYRHNADRVPSVAGAVVPEPLFSRGDYEGGLLARIYADLAPLDPDGVLRHEWVNARGCIVRFDRSALEIRVLDVQECPAADIAVAGAVIAVVRSLVEEHASSSGAQRSGHERALADILEPIIRDGDDAVIRDRGYLELFGYPDPGSARARDLWQFLIESVVSRDPVYSEWQPWLALYVRRGCLARRIVSSLGPRPGRGELERTYRRLCDCLATGTAFDGDVS